MKVKNLLWAARVVSMVFTPFYLPIVGLALLFIFSYMSMLPLSYKLGVLALVYICTILLPTYLIHAYRRYQGWSLPDLGQKERRMVPYIISIICYFACYYLMNLVHMPYFMSRILMAALLIQIVCAIINVWWKISTHTAAIGGVGGAVLAFSVLFSFDPVWWFCLTILLAGVLGSSRMILMQHSLSQVVAGFIVGFFCGLFMIL